MSVHGEYGRALESMIARVRISTHPERERWLRDLEAVRLDRHPDLSAAATACRAILDEIAATLERDRNPDPRPDPDPDPDPRPDAVGPTAYEVTWLLDGQAHLLAHCRAVLGPERPARDRPQPEPQPRPQPSSTRSTR